MIILDSDCIDATEPFCDNIIYLYDNFGLENAMDLAGLKWMSSIGKYLRADREGDLKIVQEMHPFEDLFW